MYVLKAALRKKACNVTPNLFTLVEGSTERNYGLQLIFFGAIRLKSL